MKHRLLVFFLNLYARAYLWRFGPVIVGITGNVGKTTTKEAVAAVLATTYRVRASGGNLNNELGLPLTILGDFAEEYYRGGGGFAFWVSVLWRAKLRFWTMPRRLYPEVLVLEYGADRPGDIKRLARWYKPNVAVVTAIGDVPVHVEFFASALQLAQEKSALVRAVPSDGMTVLNFDDQTVADMRRVTRGRVTTFGFGLGADVQVTNERVRLAGARPEGVQFDIATGGVAMPLLVRGTIGRGVAAASAAAVAVGRYFDIGLAQSVEALTHLTPPPGRMRILEGIRDSVLIDDSYNASPAATHLAIDSVAALPGRKVLVLGDMLELGAHSVRAHQAAGTRAATIAQILVCVGEHARFIKDAACNQMPASSIHWFADSRSAAPEVQKLITPGDVVLVKGSQGVRMERIVQEIMAEPSRAAELLVRQSKRWLDR